MGRNFVPASSEYYAVTNTVSAYPFAIVARFKIDSTSGAYTIGSWGDITNATCSNNLIVVNNRLWALSQGASNVQATNGTDLGTSEWHFGCAVFRGTSDRSVWLDSEAEVNNTSAVSPTGTFSIIRIGARSQNAALQEFDGLIGEVAFFKREPTAREIAAMAAGASPLWFMPDEYRTLVNTHPMVNATALNVSGTPDDAAHDGKVFYPASPIRWQFTADTGEVFAMPLRIQTEGLYVGSHA